MPPYVCNHSVEFFFWSLIFALKPLSFSRAVTAVNWAETRNIHKNPIGVTVCETLNWRIIFLIQRVVFTTGHLYLFRHRDSLLSYRIVRSIRIYKGKVVRGY